MDLDGNGELINIGKLKAKLKKRYPNYNFDIAPEPDRKCKVPVYCHSKDKIKYSDVEGNIFCGQRYKKTDEKNLKQAAEKLASEVQSVANELKADRIVLYPYAHLSSNLAKPGSALEVLREADKILSD